MVLWSFSLRRSRKVPALAFLVATSNASLTLFLLGLSIQTHSSKAFSNCSSSKSSTPIPTIPSTSSSSGSSTWLRTCLWDRVTAFLARFNNFPSCYDRNISSMRLLMIQRTIAGVWWIDLCHNEETNGWVGFFCYFVELITVLTDRVLSRISYCRYNINTMKGHILVCNDHIGSCLFGSSLTFWMKWGASFLPFTLLLWVYLNQRDVWWATEADVLPILKVVD